MFDKKNTFLKLIYQRFKMGRDVITSRELMLLISIPYKLETEIASYWESKGAIKRFSKRGGESEYTLTDTGKEYAKQLEKTRKQLQEKGAVVGTVLVITFLIWKGV